MSVIGGEVLVLSKDFCPAYITTLQSAVNYLFLRKAKIFVENYGFLDFEEWVEMSEFIIEMHRDEGEEIPYIQGVSRRLIKPFVIVLTNGVFEGEKKLSFSKKLLIIRDENTCQYCGKKLSKNTRSIDHVIPKSRGGKTVWTNVVLCCKKCNMKKGGRTPEEAGMKLLKKPKVPTIIEILLKYIEGREEKRYWELFLKRPF